MAYQYVVRDSNLELVQEKFEKLSDHIEIFAIEETLIGISIPIKVFDDIGNDRIRQVLSGFFVYDLWSGDWTRPA